MLNKVYKVGMEMVVKIISELLQTEAKDSLFLTG